MRLKPEQLASALGKGLAPVYCISGDEPLQLQEAADAIRARAREVGHTEREILDVDGRFDWGRLAGSGGNLSLFGARRLLELRVPSGKPGKDGSRALVDWCKQPPEDTVLLISMGRIDSRSRDSAWAKAIDRAGVFMQVWAPNGGELSNWINRRMRAAGLEPQPEAVRLIAERNEGNLLAAAQEVDKLRLLLGGGPVTVEAARAVVADSARYNVFDLAEAALAGDVRRTLRILQGLREEGEQPTLVLWSLSRDIRLVCRITAVGRVDELFRQERVFGARQKLLGQAARRADPMAWETLLRDCARIDRLIKGAGEGDAWQALRELAVDMVGVDALNDRRLNRRLSTGVF